MTISGPTPCGASGVQSSPVVVVVEVVPEVVVEVVVEVVLLELASVSEVVSVVAVVPRVSPVSVTSVVLRVDAVAVPVAVVEGCASLRVEGTSKSGLTSTHALSSGAKAETGTRTA